MSVLAVTSRRSKVYLKLFSSLSGSAKLDFQWSWDTLPYLCFR